MVGFRGLMTIREALPADHETLTTPAGSRGRR